MLCFEFINGTYKQLESILWITINQQALKDVIHADFSYGPELSLEICIDSNTKYVKDCMDQILFRNRMKVVKKEEYDEGIKYTLTWSE